MILAYSSAKKPWYVRLESMNIFQATALLLSLTALFSYLNARFLKLTPAVGSLLVALMLSLGLIVFGSAGFIGNAAGFLDGLSFDELVLQGLLSFLLFAGALNVNLDRLNQLKWPILTLATVGVAVSTLVVGSVMFFLLELLGFSVSYPYALLFGALISPTDPIAVISILKRVGVPETTETLITGESLFNDGVGVVVFSVLLSSVAAGEHGGGGLTGGLILFVQEAVGGVLFGGALGFIAFRLLKSIDDYAAEVMITLAVVTGGYALAQALHTSGPLTVVVAGILIGNRGRLLAMSDITREHLDTFWAVIDEILNAVLFVLIGLELLVLDFTPRYLWAILLAIPVVLGARFLSVSIPINLFRLRRTFQPYTVRLMVWGGLRGGISVALALSLPRSPERDLLIALTYGVVVFSVLVQGLTVGRVARRAKVRVIKTP